MPTPEVTGYAALQSEEIKKIAREYAKEILSKQPVRPHAIPEIWAKAVADTERALSELYEPLIAHISRDYCIVPKEEIKADYNSNALAAGQFAKGAGARCAQMREWHQGKCDELISLFGKELFEEGKE